MPVQLPSKRRRRYFIPNFLDTALFVLAEFLLNQDKRNTHTLTYWVTTWYGAVSWYVFNNCFDLTVGVSIMMFVCWYLREECLNGLLYECWANKLWNVPIEYSQCFILSYSCGTRITWALKDMSSVWCFLVFQGARAFVQILKFDEHCCSMQTWSEREVELTKREQDLVLLEERITGNERVKISLIIFSETHTDLECNGPWSLKINSNNGIIRFTTPIMLSLAVLKKEIQSHPFFVLCSSSILMFKICIS